MTVFQAAVGPGEAPPPDSVAPRDSSADAPTSVARLVETRFGLPALTARDANAWPLFDLFDWEHPDTSVPALPEAVIDPMHDTDCKAAFP